jgi:hypothetical protein
VGCEYRSVISIDSRPQDLLDRLQRRAPHDEVAPEGWRSPCVVRCFASGGEEELAGWQGWAGRRARPPLTVVAGPAGRRELHPPGPAMRGRSTSRPDVGLWSVPLADQT